MSYSYSYSSAAPLPIGRPLSAPASNVTISFGLCLIPIVISLLASDLFQHWFIVPVYVCGGLIGVDAVKWARRQYDAYDPAGILGLLGIHFFFLAPLLHVFWDWWMWYVPPPEDWRQWLGGMGILNAAGIGLYQISRNWIYHWTSSKGPMHREWALDPTQFFVLLIPILLVAGGLQMFVYLQFGGIGGYIDAFNAVVAGENPFDGMGWLFLIPESFPILVMMGYAVWRRNQPGTIPWLELAVVVVVFIGLKFLFGGLRGNRGIMLYGLFWGLGILHYWLRPLPRKLFAAGLIVFLPFMYVYGLYKSFGSEAWVSFTTVEGRTLMETNSHRSMELVLLADLGRSDVQAYLLYRALSRSGEAPYEYAGGRTYLGALALLIPGRIWPDRPATKVKEGTEVLFGRSVYELSSFRTSNAYGLAGETLLNFPPPVVPCAFALLGLLVGIVQRHLHTLSRGDSRFLLAPFWISLCFMVLVWDSDILLYYITTYLTVPALVVLVTSTRNARLDH
jgi:hypothetical protein